MSFGRTRTTIIFRPEVLQCSPNRCLRLPQKLRFGPGFYKPGMTVTWRKVSLHLARPNNTFHARFVMSASEQLTFAAQRPRAQCSVCGSTTARRPGTLAGVQELVAQLPTALTRSRNSVTNLATLGRPVSLQVLPVPEQSKRSIACTYQASSSSARSREPSSGPAARSLQKTLQPFLPRSSSVHPRASVSVPARRA